MADVRTTFSGLCMFVPDPDCKLVHALFPRAGRDASGGAGSGAGHAAHPDHEAHFARLVYDVMHEAPDVPNDPDPDKHRYRSVDVDGFCVDVGGGGATPLACALDGDQLLLLDGRVCFAGVRGQYRADVAEGQGLTGRAVVRSGRAGYCHGLQDGTGVVCGNGSLRSPVMEYAITEACAGGRERTQRMAYAVRWEVGSIGGPVTLRKLLTLTRLSEVVSARFRPDADVHFDDVADRELYPNPADGVIDLKLMHVVERELPKPGGSMTPPQGNGTAHFATYYDLSDPPPVPVEVPREVNLLQNRTILVGANCAVSQGRFRG